ncbi:SRPBCC family protein [Bradyrhizobium sp. LHD-71]|uniref:SRPBCC family protein n=1 Tax=Bradyrhizobium sp. LHD-71 TaxID=3072141 RepID=UPI00280CC0F0|nr:SRPBCC family protein [Bradyrhizobium sp. LHD-71]MDQ8730596.1 SRPBCC family protein [Bradyrhizobium sp. LHD-71]
MDARNELTLSVTTPSDREIVLTRTFDAPRALVWDAMTKAEHVRRWYGCASVSLAVCDIDLRVGGSYRFTMRTQDGVDHTMTGVYREIVAPERIVHTERYETTAFTSPDALVTMTLTEQRGRTKLQSVILHPNQDSRDAHLSAGMENGAGEMFDRLAALLTTMS